MANSAARNEHYRNNRRLARQILGGFALVFILIGLFTVIGWIVGAVRTALDDTGIKEEYANRVYGLVIFDTPAFEDAAEVDSSVFKQAAIWSCVYQAQLTQGSLDGYERDAETGSVKLPRLEVDTYLTNLLGADYTVEDGAFSTAEFNYYYDEASQCYLVPVTGSVALYNPEVEKIATKGKTRTVTVGYIPTLNNISSTELSLTAPTEPTKYMDYVFTKRDGSWCLTALQASEMQPAVTPTPTPAEQGMDDPQAMVESSLNGGEAETDAAEATAEESTAGADVLPDAQYEIGVDGVGEDTPEETPEEDGTGGDAEAADEEQQ